MWCSHYRLTPDRSLPPNPKVTWAEALSRSVTMRKMPTKITIRDNGSIRVEGDFTIHDVNGNPFDLAGRETIGLCRCGQSENKPFCDGTHGKIGFKSVCPARALPPPVAKA
jgi:CDGSH-type Zn-finger protein